MRRLQIISFSAVLIVCLLASCSGSSQQNAAGGTDAPVGSAAQALTASLSEISGNVLLRQAQETDFSAASEGDILQPAGQVTTQTASRVRLDLSSGALIRLAENTLFTLQEAEQTPDGFFARVGLELGRIWIILNGGTLEVNTPSGLASVRGSYMSVSYFPDSGEVRITCLEGTCTLENESGSVVLSAGQSAVIRGVGQAPESGEMSEEDIKEWLENNPEAEIVVAALTEAPLPVTELPPGTETPLATVPPVATLPTTIPPLPPVIYNPPSSGEKEPPDEPPASLVPTVNLTGNIPTSIFYGESVPVTVEVLPSDGGPVPSGTVTVKANGTPICSATLDASGSAACSGSVLAIGSVDLEAFYGGDGSYLSAFSSVLPLSVFQTSTTTIIHVQDPNPSLKDNSVLFVATVDNPYGGMPTGSVQFTDGTYSCTVTSAPWQCSIIFPVNGPRMVNAYYSGDANFVSSSSAYVTQDVLFSVNSEFLNEFGPGTNTPVFINTTADCTQFYTVKVLDVDGISEVHIEYSLDDSTFMGTTTMAALSNGGSGNTWSGDILIPASAAQTAYWRFRAKDNLGNWTYFAGGAASTVGYPATSSYNFGFGVACP